MTGSTTRNKIRLPELKRHLKGVLAAAAPKGMPESTRLFVWHLIDRMPNKKTLKARLLGTYGDVFKEVDFLYS